MNPAEQVLQEVRTWHRLPAGTLVNRLHISRATLMRAVQMLGRSLVTRGNARRTAYAARRSIRGSTLSIPIFRVDENGCGAEIATLDAIYPAGCALLFKALFEWPLPDAMRDGWVKDIPYFFHDMRPQGFLGAHFARQNADVLQVPLNPDTWCEDDVLHVLSMLGADLPGNYIVGESAYRRFLTEVQEGAHFLLDTETEAAYMARAQEALTFSVAGSQVGGDFPKFTERRLIDGEPTHVIVKFSGADDSSGSQRWADLLVCEHLALDTVSEHLRVKAASSRIYQAGGRTFLEVQRFDRHGGLGRSAVCSLDGLNDALIDQPGKSWVSGAAALKRRNFIDEAAEKDIQRIWHFGQLIANSDMHDGNLAFEPGPEQTLNLAPVYDMLPMHYVPVRGMELPERQFKPSLPFPNEQRIWQEAADAAVVFWHRASQDGRISSGFRKTCAENAETVVTLSRSPMLTALADSR